ncbi:cytochrome b5-like [Leguminivora glycinivorella]|uniref:cytochrome b5-like n=1 Tax=Leguminivora glycinivorella TaxID=1035111 RepID=UPI00200D75BE|nr:cytochrome b5-like [Leguminivora glycinivorella]
MSNQKQYTRAEVEAQNTQNATLFVIHNKVYNVTPFLDEHPGGHEVLVGVGGTDASEDFDDIGHSIDARDIMKKYLVGEIVESERVEKAKKIVKWDDVKNDGGSGFLSIWRIPLIAAVVASLVYLYFT